MTDLYSKKKEASGGIEPLVVDLHPDEAWLETERQSVSSGIDAVFGSVRCIIAILRPLGGRWF
jgi:hypothetical protein